MRYKYKSAAQTCRCWPCSRRASSRRACVCRRGGRARLSRIFMLHSAGRGGRQYAALPCIAEPPDGAPPAWIYAHSFVPHTIHSGPFPHARTRTQIPTRRHSSANREGAARQSAAQIASPGTHVGVGAGALVTPGKSSAQSEHTLVAYQTFSIETANLCDRQAAHTRHGPCRVGRPTEGLASSAWRCSASTGAAGVASVHGIHR